MGGKLEKKLEVVAVEEEINRPAWMGGNPKKFTKEQHKEIKDFDLYLKVHMLFHDLGLEHQIMECLVQFPSLCDLAIFYNMLSMSWCVASRLSSEVITIPLE
jgi:hypothetical protein